MKCKECGVRILNKPIGTYCRWANKVCEGVEPEQIMPGEPKPPEIIAEEKKENTYRDQLIQEIKDVGESLIYNAENIAGDYKFGCSLEMHISFDKFEGPTVRVKRDFYPENYMYKLMGK